MRVLLAPLPHNCVLFSAYILSSALCPALCWHVTRCQAVCCSALHSFCVCFPGSLKLLLCGDEALG